jgi:hypothetical protein
MSFLYISTNKKCVLKINFLGGGTPSNGKVFNHSYFYQGINFIFLSLMKKEKKNKNLFKYICVHEYINSFKNIPWK